jgi:hypothetical protein
MPKQSCHRRSERRNARGFGTRESVLSHEPFPPGIPIQGEGQLTVTVPEGFKVILSREAFAQLFGYVYATHVEISCLGTVSREEKSFRINRFYLLKQTGSAAHTELVPEAVAELVEGLVSEGKDAEARSIRAWAHSHPGIGLFWSGTDETTCRTLVSDYLVSLVVGEAFSIRCRIDLAGPVPLTLDEVPVYHESMIDEDVLAACRDEVREKIASEPLLHALRGDCGEEQLPLSTGVESFCERCWGWHDEERCPMQDLGLEGWPDGEGVGRF